MKKNPLTALLFSCSFGATTHQIDDDFGISATANEKYTPKPYNKGCLDKNVVNFMPVSW